MKILSSNDSEDWLLIRMKEMMKHKMMNRFHKRNSSSASYVDFKSGEKLDFKFSTLQALQVYLFRFSYTQLLSVPLCHFRWIVKRFFNWCCLIWILFFFYLWLKAKPHSQYIEIFTWWMFVFFILRALILYYLYMLHERCLWECLKENVFCQNS